MLTVLQQDLENRWVHQQDIKTIKFEKVKEVPLGLLISGAPLENAAYI